MNTPQTSREAYEAIKPVRERLEEEVYDFIKFCGSDGATDDEVQVGLGMRAQTQTSRRWALRGKGRVVDTGRRRPTRAGRSAIVWVAV